MRRVGARRLQGLGAPVMEGGGRACPMGEGAMPSGSTASGDALVEAGFNF